MNETEAEARKLFGARVAAKRAERALTVGRLADAAGLTASHMFQVERGDAALSPNQMSAIAWALATPLEALTEGISDVYTAFRDRRYLKRPLAGSNQPFKNR